MQDNTFAALKIKKDDRKLYESLKLDRASLLRGSNSLMATPMSTSQNTRFSLLQSAKNGNTTADGKARNFDTNVVSQNNFTDKNEDLVQFDNGNLVLDEPTNKTQSNAAISSQKAHFFKRNSKSRQRCAYK